MRFMLIRAGLSHSLARVHSVLVVGDCVLRVQQSGFRPFAETSETREVLSVIILMLLLLLIELLLLLRLLLLLIIIIIIITIQVLFSLYKQRMTKNKLTYISTNKTCYENIT